MTFLSGILIIFCVTLLVLMVWPKVLRFTKSRNYVIYKPIGWIFDYPKIDLAKDVYVNKDNYLYLTHNRKLLQFLSDIEIDNFLKKHKHLKINNLEYLVEVDKNYQIKATLI